MKIYKPDWDWNGKPVNRSGPASGYFVHHSAGALTAAAIHAMHRKLGWRGVGYQYVIEPTRIVRGRPESAIGGHTKGWNDGIGVCFGGNFDTTKHMPEKQLELGQELFDYLSEKRPGLAWTLHKNTPGNATACPGRYFPWAEIRLGVPAAPKRIALTKRSITVPRMYRPHRAGWWNIWLRDQFIVQIRRQGDGDRLELAGDPIVIPVPVVKPKQWRKVMAWKKQVRQEKLALAIAAGKRTPVQGMPDADLILSDVLEIEQLGDPQELEEYIPGKRPPLF